MTNLVLSSQISTAFYFPSQNMQTIFRLRKYSLFLVIEVFFIISWDIFYNFSLTIKKKNGIRKQLLVPNI